MYKGRINVLLGELEPRPEECIDKKGKRRAKFPI